MKDFVVNIKSTKNKQTNKNTTVKTSQIHNSRDCIFTFFFLFQYVFSEDVKTCKGKYCTGIQYRSQWAGCTCSSSLCRYFMLKYTRLNWIR